MTKWIWHRAPREQAPPNWNSRVRPAQTSRVEYLYAWERRCRGYDLFSGPVRLEPLFIPYGEILMTAADDPAFLLCALSFPTALTYLPLRLPTAQKVTAPLCSSFLSGLSSVVSPLAFEIIGSHQEVAYQLAVSADDVAEVRTHLNVHFPLAETADGEDSLQQHLAPLKSLPLGYQVIDFGLYHPVYMPLQQFSSFTLDPLSGLVGVLAHLGPQEVAGLQVLFTPAQSNWLQSLERVVAEFDGGQPARESDLHKQARQKLAGSLWACVIRVFAVSAEGDARAFGLCQRLGRALASLSGAGTNSLIALDNRGYDDETHFLGLVERS
ncbi:MAG: hypothetical protein JOZ57_10905, partial [Abitibacteriaceae bacterium]|nr:hypothetical protein [Abditibacteriaceae bacterium]